MTGQLQTSVLIRALHMHNDWAVAKKFMMINTWQLR